MVPLVAIQLPAGLMTFVVDGWPDDPGHDAGAHGGEARWPMGTKRRPPKNEEGRAAGRSGTGCYMKAAMRPMAMPPMTPVSHLRVHRVGAAGGRVDGDQETLEHQVAHGLRPGRAAPALTLG